MKRGDPAYKAPIVNEPNNQPNEPTAPPVGCPAHERSMPIGPPSHSGATQIHGGRTHEKKLVLSMDGQIPAFPATVEHEEQEVAISSIACLWRAIDFVRAANQRRINAGPVPTGAETYLARKRWGLSHHLFIPLKAMIGHALLKAVHAMGNGRREHVREWVDLAAQMRRGCGALFLYGVDFQPCQAIYCGRIRNEMPPAFSGYEIRERQNALQPALESFNAAFSKNSQSGLVEELRSRWVEAERKYKELHDRCKIQAVPPDKADGSKTSSSKPESLLGAYLRTHGEVPPITEETYREYDQWFAIERAPDVSRLDYIYQICDVMERLLADLLVGHRLDQSVIDDLFGGMRAALVVFGHWVGPVHDASPFYPKSLRGE